MKRTLYVSAIKTLTYTKLKNDYNKTQKNI